MIYNLLLYSTLTLSQSNKVYQLTIRHSRKYLLIFDARVLEIKLEFLKVIDTPSSDGIRPVEGSFPAAPC